MSNFDRIGKFTILGNNGLEDFDKMCQYCLARPTVLDDCLLTFADERFPLAGPYWDSKRAELDKIKIPIFIKGNWRDSFRRCLSLMSCVYYRYR